jgi:4-amino-4-deoxy-L-arabinose transferase-like glycosyltransferase
MGEIRLGGLALVYLAFLSALVFLPGLGSSSRLTYHEAFVAQGAREMLNSGNWAYPTIGGLPWLEKPPLPWWLVTAFSWCAGEVNETTARLPSALAATGLVLGIAIFTTRHYGLYVGLLAGAVQATTAWTVIRGRLAEADILLACLVTWTIVAFDAIFVCTVEHSARSITRTPIWRSAFVVLLGTTALVKGIGFGAVLIFSVLIGVLAWQRNLVLARRLLNPWVWIFAAVIALLWPLGMVVLHGYGALSLWTTHVSDRLIPQHGPGPFAGEPCWEYVVGLLGQALPWTPLTFIGARNSLARALIGRERGDCRVGRDTAMIVVLGDRMLWAWAIAPLAMLALAPVKNAHYAISAQLPWSVWAALALGRFGARLQDYGVAQRVFVRATCAGFIILALAYGLSFWLLGPRFDRRGAEWAFYEVVGREVPRDMAITLLYDDWDRNPYESPFGRIPHDLAVRLFYLQRSACWHMGAESLLAHQHIARGLSGSTVCCIPRKAASVGKDRPIAMIGRSRDVPVLERFARVEAIAQGPSIRSDRTYSLFRVTPGSPALHSASQVGSIERAGHR